MRTWLQMRALATEGRAVGLVSTIRGQEAERECATPKARDPREMVNGSVKYSNDTTCICDAMCKGAKVRDETPRT